MYFLVLMIISFIFIFLAYKLLNKPQKLKLPPGPYPWPIVGNLYNLKPVRCKCFSDWSKTYGPIISVWQGSKLHIVISSSELAREVLKDNDQQLANRQRITTTPINGTNNKEKDFIWADYGPHYVKLRMICTRELFSPRSLEALRSVREDEVAAMVGWIFQECRKLDNGSRCLVLRKYVGSATLNVITKLAFGKRVVNPTEEDSMDNLGLEFKEILTEEAKLGASLAMTENIPTLLKWILRIENKKAFRAHEERKDKLIDSILQERIPEGRTQDFANTLFQLKDKYELSDDTIYAVLWNMINAGADTTAISVEWAMAELIRNPRTQKKAQAELDTVIGQNRIMTEADIPNLPYLQSIVKESLRMHPPTPLMLPHMSNSGVKIGGYDVPKGSVVHVNVWSMGRNPDIWKDPLIFRPERFLEETVDVKGQDFRLIPFGSGRRMCPAAQLGLNLVAAMVGRLLHQFRWTTEEVIEMKESAGLVCYMETPLRAMVETRLSTCNNDCHSKF